jgi:hypothetical protein
MWIKILPALSVVALLFIGSCSKEQPFAYKTFDMDSYRNMGEHFEFPADKAFDWVCKLSGNPGSRITVIVQKKELVWVDITKEAQNFNKKSPFVHGRIEGLEPGEYKIILISGSKASAEYEFRLFNGEYPEREDD